MPKRRPSHPQKALLELDDPAQSASGKRLAAEESRVTPPSTAPRPTVIPKFDPSKFAADSEVRGRMATITDEAALEHARLQSFPTNAPPAHTRNTSIPGSLPGPRDSLPEIDVGESDLDALGADEQVAILRARLAPLSRVPALVRSMAEGSAPQSDPKTAYVTGFIDGLLPLETIIDVTGLPELDTLQVLDRLMSLGALRLK